MFLILLSLLWILDWAVLIIRNHLRIIGDITLNSWWKRRTHVINDLASHRVRLLQEWIIFASVLLQLFEFPFWDMHFSKQLLVQFWESSPCERVSARHLVHVAIVSIDLQIVLILRLHCFAVDYRACQLEGPKLFNIPVVLLLDYLLPDARKAALLIISLVKLCIFGNADSVCKQGTQPQVFEGQVAFLICVPPVLQVINEVVNLWDHGAECPLIVFLDLDLSLKRCLVTAQEKTQVDSGKELPHNWSDLP